MADALFTNCDVITMGDVTPEAQAVAVKGGHVMAVGSVEELTPLVVKHTKEVNLRGHTLLPGFIEAHSHPIMSAVDFQHRINVSDATNATAAWDKVRATVRSVRNGEWVSVVGWNPLLVQGLAYPTRSELDNVSTEHAITVSPPHGHAVFANSLALERAGLTDASIPDEGTVYDRDAQGRLTGGVRGVFGILGLLAHRPIVPGVIGRKLLRSQLLDYARNGFTTVVAMGLFYDIKGARRTLEELLGAPTAPIRLVAYERETTLRSRLETNVTGVPGRDNFCPIGTKWWADGSPYAGTMATCEPYLDTAVTRETLGFPEYPCRGNLNYSTADVLYKSMLPYHIKGLRLATHAHGDRAIQIVLDAYEKLLQSHPRPDPRYRLEHCGLITNDQLAHAQRLGVTCSFYIDHIYFYGDILKDGILGASRAERFMPLYSAQKAGHRWSLHSDSPCSPLGPLRCIQAAVTRGVRRGDHVGRDPLGPEQTVSVTDALRAYTTSAAWQIAHDHVIGSIVPGKIADFTVLSGDPRKVDPYEIMDIEVVGTYKAGRFVQPYEVDL